MPQNVKVDTILMKEWPGVPQLPGLKTEPCFGDWSLVKMMDALAMDRKILAAGWNFFFMATESQDDVSWVPWGREGTERIEADLGEGEAAELQWS
jgi:hypothetical protein